MTALPHCPWLGPGRETSVVMNKCSFECSQRVGWGIQRRAANTERMDLLAVLLLGIAIGCAIGYLYARSRLAASAERTRAAEERARLIEGQLTDRFEALSARAVDASTARFLDVAEERLENRRAAVENMVEPLKATLARDRKSVV